MRDVVKIETERLMLRPLRLTDAACVAAFTADPDVARMVTSIPLPQMPVAAEGFILIHLARRPLGREFVFAIELASEGLIGVIGLHACKPGKQSGAGFELGYWIGKPYWGQGYATEAGAALLEAATGLGPIEASHFVDNPASGRVLEKLGFRASGQAAERFSLARGQRAPVRPMLRSPTRARATGGGVRAPASQGAACLGLAPC